MHTEHSALCAAGADRQVGHVTDVTAAMRSAMRLFILSTCRYTVPRMGQGIAILVLTLLAYAVTGFAQVAPQNGDWPMYGRDPGGTRFSPLDQINAENVSRLRSAWTYHTGERGRS